MALVLAIAVASSVANAADHTDKRAFTIDDALNTQELTDAALAPHGETFALVVKRAPVDGARFDLLFMEGRERSDIWIGSERSPKAINITDGASDRTGWWSPAWSPGGDHLAAASTRGGDGVFQWIKRKGRDDFEQVINRPIATSFETRSGAVWLSDDDLLVAVLDYGEKPLFWESLDVFRRPVELWKRFALGDSTTALVTDSRNAAGAWGPYESNTVEFIVYNARTGRDRSLGKTELARGASLSVSPDGRYLIAARPVKIDDPDTFSAASMGSELLLIDLNAKTGVDVRPAIKMLMFAGSSWTDNRSGTVLGKTLDDSYDGVLERYENLAQYDFHINDGHIVITESEEPAEIESFGAGDQNVLAEIGAHRLTKDAGDGEMIVRYTSQGLEDDVEVLHLNAHLAEIDVGPLVSINQVDASGKNYGYSIVQMPPENLCAKHCPAVVWVYSGFEYAEDTVPRDATLHRWARLPLQRLSSLGIAVIHPSMPIPPTSVQREPAFSGIGPVGAAIRSAAAQELVDVERVAVMGLSFGGYDVNALLAHTEFFKAGVAMASTSNLASSYGTFTPRVRYSESIDIGPILMERGQYSLQVPPWEDPELYIRNSPVFQVDQIDAPLLLIHSDVDFVPISQAEEMFTALNRLGKPVRFLRFIGDDHVIQSPANVRRMWDEIESFLASPLRLDLQ